MRKRIKFFVSYAHGNQQLAVNFVFRLNEVLLPSKRYDYRCWMDTGLVVGEEWEAQIFDAMDKCDLGILLVSPTFLGSKFIGEQELPYLLDNKKPVIPVMLQSVNFDLHDLKGLDKLQIFRYKGKRFTEPRSYSECKSSARIDFINALFEQIESKLSLMH